MSKYEHFEGEGFSAVVRNTEEVIMQIGTMPGIEVTKEAFKELKGDPTKFDKKKHEIKEKKDVNKNE